MCLMDNCGEGGGILLTDRGAMSGRPRAMGRGGNLPDSLLLKGARWTM